MRFGQPKIPCLPEATPADALRMRALNAGPRRILLIELFGRLVLSCGVQRLIGLPCLEAHDAGFLLRPGTLRAVRTGRAILPGKARFPRHPIFGIGIWEPGDTLLAHGTGDHLLVPVDQKLRFVEPRARPGLPTGVISYGQKIQNQLCGRIYNPALGLC